MPLALQEEGWSILGKLHLFADVRQGDHLLGSTYSSTAGDRFSNSICAVSCSLEVGFNRLVHTHLYFVALQSSRS